MSERMKAVMRELINQYVAQAAHEVVYTTRHVDATRLLVDLARENRELRERTIESFRVTQDRLGELARLNHELEDQVRILRAAVNELVAEVKYVKATVTRVPVAS